MWTGCTAMDGIDSEKARNPSSSHVSELCPCSQLPFGLVCGHILDNEGDGNVRHMCIKYIVYDFMVEMDFERN